MVARQNQLETTVCRKSKTPTSLATSQLVLISFDESPDHLLNFVCSCVNFSTPTADRRKARRSKMPKFAS
jgi:hypothetical protein